MQPRVTAAFELFAFKSNYNQVLINEAQYQLMRECLNHFRIISSITEYCRNKNEMTG